MVENNVQSKQPFFMQNIMVDWGRFQGLENFQYPNFQVPNFQGANIQGPSFQGPNIQGPSFQDPNLQVPNSQGPGPDHNLQPNNFR